MLILNKNNKLSDKKLRKLLIVLNFNIYSNGTKYLIEAIQIAYQKPYLLKTIQDIYDIISVKYATSSNSVKWAIRNSIESMNRNTSDEEIHKRLHISGYRKMTPKYFIPLVISNLITP